MPDSTSFPPRHTLGYLSGAPRVSTRWDGESGGARSHVLGVIGAFEQLGWRVRRYIYGDRIDPSTKSASLAARVLQGTTAGRAAADVTRLILGARSSRRALAEIGTDVGFVYERYAVFQGLGRAFKCRGVPWFIETQGLFFHEAKFERKSIAMHRLARRHELAVYKEADVVIAVTQVLKELILRELPLDPGKILVVSNGVDTERFKPRASTRPISDRDVELGFVGGLLEWQGLDILLRAMRRCLDTGVGYRLTVAGDGPERVSLETLAAELRLGDRVTFLGRVDGNRVQEVIAGFEIGFSGHAPSAIGGMYHSPLKLYEYMAMGKPVIASDFSDARALIPTERTGFLFVPGDEHVLAQVLTAAAAMRPHLQEMGARARELIEREHSWRARVARMIEDTRHIVLARSRLRDATSDRAA